MTMAGPPPAVAAVRSAVRASLTDFDATPGSLVLVACSGGADSLALAAATAFVAPRMGLRAGALIVDHSLQQGSDEVARRAAGQCRAMGLNPVRVLTVTVDQAPPGGPEAQARAVRYAGLSASAQRLEAAAVLLGHTRDDQAEQVLLGLLRGSGARSLSGMPPVRELGGQVQLVRPLLTVSRHQTRQVCAELGLTPWEDPHNDDPRFARVRARQVLEQMNRQLGPAMTSSLARTASLLRDDAEVLDEMAQTAQWQLGELPWPVAELERLRRAIRTRLWHAAALQARSPGTDLTAEHVAAIDALITHWRGQGPLHLPGGVRAYREDDQVWITGPAPS